MSAAHTPGPWEYFYKPKYDEHHVSLPLPGQTMRLALFVDGCPSERPEADARLIAAAPEMLAVLLKLRRGDLHQRVRPLYDEAQAVIAKATGGAK